MLGIKNVDFYQQQANPRGFEQSYAGLSSGSESVIGYRNNPLWAEFNLNTMPSTLASLQTFHTE